MSHKVKFPATTTLVSQTVLSGSRSILYDKQGNPVSYLGDTLTWEKGRQFKSFVKSDGTASSYTYNADGIRTGKTVNGVYMLDRSKILREETNQKIRNF